MRRWAIAAVAACAAFLCGSSGSAAPPAIDDVLLTIKVRTILYQDEELRHHNIGVQVVGRVAILFGPVSNVDVGLRAESRLRGLVELRDVRNELDVLQDFLDFIPDRLPSPAPEPGLELRPRFLDPFQALDRKAQG